MTAYHRVILATARDHTTCQQQQGTARDKKAPQGSVIFINENENENGEKRENNEFVNEN